MSVSHLDEERDGGGRVELDGRFPWSDPEHEPEELLRERRRRERQQWRERREVVHLGRYLLICAAVAAVVLFLLSRYATFTGSSSPSAGGTSAARQAAERLVLPDGTLAAGSAGVEVKVLQQALWAAGALSGPVDGVFGAQTAAAVAAFQRQAGLPASGVYGPSTRAALEKTLRSG